MKKQEVLEELEIQFKKTKQRLKFKSTFEEINKISYIEDMAISQGFVSNQFSRQMINRMVDTYYNWIGEIYSWIYPSPSDLIHMNESKKLTKEERTELLLMIDRIMFLARKSKRIAFGGLEKKEESSFVDELVEFSEKYFNPFMLKYHKKFENLWKEEISKQKENIN